MMPKTTIHNDRPDDNGHDTIHGGKDSFRLKPLLIAAGVAISGWSAQGHAAVIPGATATPRPRARGRSTHSSTWILRTGPLGSRRGKRHKALATNHTEIVFLDSRVPDSPALIQALRPGRKLVMLRPDSDGLRQIANVVREYPHLDAIHIVSHGNRGELLLGRGVVNLATLDQHQGALNTIRHALGGGGDLMLYGCDVAAGAAGSAFIAALAQATGANVAASTDATGAADLGGDWDLEIATGEIDTAVPFQINELKDWDYVLYNATVTTENQLSSALSSAALDSANDVITISGTISLSGTVDLSGWNSGTSGNLTLQGDGGGNDILDGGYGGFRVLDIGANANVTLDSLIIQKGLLAGVGGNISDYSAPNGIGGNGGDSLGAGIRNAGTLTIVSSTVAHNFASGGGGGAGYKGNFSFYAAGGGGGAGTSGGRGAAGGQWPNYGYVSARSSTYGSGSGSIGGNGASEEGGLSSAYTGQGGGTTGGAGYDGSYHHIGYGGAGGTAYDGAGNAQIGGGGGGGSSYGGDATLRVAGGGGNAVGGIYNTGTLTILTSTIADNFGAGGGGATVVGSNATLGDGGFGVGGIYNNGGTLRWDSATDGNFSNNGGGGGHRGVAGSALSSPPAASDGASANAYFNDGNSDGVSDTINLNTNYTPYNSDGDVTAGAGVIEPVPIPTTATGPGSAVNIYDFTISDGGGGDGDPMTVSQIKVHTGGTVDPTKLTYRLNGPDASNVTGTYSSGVVTFSGLSISVADGGFETYTVNVYYNDNTGLTENQTLTLSTDGDTDFTVGSSGTQMGTTSPVTNGSGSTVEVTATKLAFTTEPNGSVSGSALTTQPVVAAEDAAGNTDVDFTGNVALTEASAGTLSGTTTVSAANGVATYTNVTYTATADQQSFTLTASATSLTDGTSTKVTSDVVATRLTFATEPAPTAIQSGVFTSFSTVPVVEAVDANNTLDTGYSTSFVLSVTDPNDGVVDGTVNSLTGTGDIDGSGTTVTLTPSSGAATFSGLAIQYTNGGASDTIALQATSGGLSATNSVNITSNAAPVVTDGNISISGGSGTGGAYKIGDVVTAIWDNTGTGDNNAGVTGVTVDFRQFGGGAAVSASNSNGTWTATYTITPGTIDATKRNVSVSATNAGGTTTTADSTNATVDNVMPSTPSTPDLMASSDTGISNTDNITADTTPTLTGTADANVTVTMFSNQDGTLGTTTADNSGNWSFTPASPLSAATHALTALATDAVGNVSATSGALNVTVVVAAPGISSITLPANGLYGLNQPLDFKVIFDRPVYVDTSGGTPRLVLTFGPTSRALNISKAKELTRNVALKAGSITRYADYVSGSGSKTLLFRYRVQSGDVDYDGISLAPTLDLNGGSIRGIAGIVASTGLTKAGNLAGVLVSAPKLSVQAVPALNRWWSVLLITLLGATVGFRRRRRQERE